MKPKNLFIIFILSTSILASCNQKKENLSHSDSLSIYKAFKTNNTLITESNDTTITERVKQILDLANELNNSNE